MICQKISYSQEGNQNALLELIRDFSPLIKKYANKIDSEDAYQDLQVCFIELIFRMPESILLQNDSARAVAYIARSMRNSYIYLSKKANKRECERVISSLDDRQLYMLECESACVENYNDIFYVLQSILSREEKELIVNIYYHGYSVTEIANKKHVSRQAINQAKNRALEKIKKYYEQ